MNVPGTFDMPGTWIYNVIDGMKTVTPSLYNYITLSSLLLFPLVAISLWLLAFGFYQILAKSQKLNAALLNPT
jgi:hypothetical protein